MSKIKSHSGAKKRIRRTGGGKLAFQRRAKNHLLMQKSARQKRLPRTVVAASVDTKALKSLLPYL